MNAAIRRHLSLPYQQLTQNLRIILPRNANDMAHGNNCREIQTTQRHLPLQVDLQTNPEIRVLRIIFKLSKESATIAQQN